jgi:hypothetical protein
LTFPAQSGLLVTEHGMADKTKSAAGRGSPKDEPFDFWQQANAMA